MDIRCSTCLLRPLVLADAASLALHANDRDVWLNLRDRFPHPYSDRDAEEYIAAVAARPLFAEVVQDHLGARALDRIFPGFAASPRDFLGIT